MVADRQGFKSLSGKTERMDVPIYTALVSLGISLVWSEQTYSILQKVSFGDSKHLVELAIWLDVHDGPVPVSDTDCDASSY
jgi:hypothetical protein